MSVEKLVERFGEHLSRRHFLVRAGAFAVGASLGLMGGRPGKRSPMVVEATHTCPNLCYEDSGSCSGCDCIWCWQECVNGVALYNCCECYMPPYNGPCNGQDCENVGCSYSQYLGSCGGGGDDRPGAP